MMIIWALKKKSYTRDPSSQNDHYERENMKNMKIQSNFLGYNLQISHSEVVVDLNILFEIYI